MKPERWQQIDQLFHSTLEWPPPERATFLSERCGDDEDLRRETESLLLAHERTTDFLDLPALEVSTELFAECLAGLMTGQQIGSYKVLSVLGIGGMGEVYLAHDSRLGRKIALKLLAPDFARDHQRVLRFEQEARAASALNHPNVCVIHDIAETKDGRHFIAMEHIDGVTLRERIARRPLTVREALHLADQIAAALAAAHAAGVLHRDIKPENIMLRKDGYVKVLDFGLAKLSEPESPWPANTSARISNVHTEPGMQMGTVKYMSPEQLREGPVDERTDVWSLGVVLYEMVTGRTPFEEGNRNEIIAAILKRQPARLEFPDNIPADFRRLVERAISNEREERYQTINALAADLRSIREGLGALVEGNSLSTGYEAAADIQHTWPAKKGKTGQTSILWSSAMTFASRTAGQVFTEIKDRPGTTVLAGIAVILILIAGLNGLRPRGPKQALTGFETITMTQATNGGQAILAAISPDGKSFAHVAKKDGKQELLVTSILTAGNSTVIAPRDVFYRGLAFSPDGNYLYFTQSDTGNDSGVLYQITLPGGVQKKILEGVDSPVSFNSNGSRFSFVRFKPAAGEYALMIADSDGTHEQVIALRRDGNALSLGGPAWSPDDRTIVCGAGWWDTGYHMNLIAVDPASGREKAINQQQWFSISQIAWVKDKGTLIFSAQERPVSPNQLWRISYPLGEADRITTDVTDYTGVSLPQDGSRIVSVGRHYNSGIWIVPEGDANRARTIANRNGVWSYGLAWTSQGKIVSSAMAGKNLNISLLEPDGSKQTQLTVNAGDNYNPATSPDGRFIVFASNRTGQFNIWRMNAKDGSDPTQITFSDGNFYPSSSTDSQWITYENQSRDNFFVWKVPMAGGVPVQLTNKYSRMPVVSPDNQAIACRYYIQEGRRGIAIIPMQGGTPTQLLPIPIVEWQKIQWSADGRSLTYVQTLNGVSNLWSYDLSTGATKRITNFTAEEIFSYAWSPDYKQLACERGAAVSDVTVLDHE
jgi:serine/threonine protein kinase/Tol biopolymer transport system component